MPSELTFTVRADDKGAIAILDATGKAIARIGEQSDEANRKANQSGSAFSGLGAKIIELKNSLDLMGMAMHAAHTAMDALFAGISRGGELADMSQRLGVSVELLSSFELGARTAGLSLGDLGTGFRFLSKSMEDAKSGGDEAAEAFKRVGISAADLQNLNTEEVMMKIAEAFSHVENGSAKTALAMQLFGRSGAQLIPFLNEGAEGLRKFQEMSDKLGLTLSTSTAKSLDSIGDSMDIMKGAVEGVQQQLAAGMAPALERLAQRAVDVTTELGIANGGVREFGGQIGELLSEYIDPAIIRLREFAQTAKLEGFGVAISDALGDAESALKAKALELGAVIGQAISDGIVDNIIIDAERILSKIPLAGVLLKIREAYNAATAVPDFDTGAVPFTEIEAGWRKTERAIQSASDALDRNAAVSRLAGGAYVMMGGDVALAAQKLDQLPPAANRGADAANKLSAQLKGSAETIRQIELALSGQKSLTQAFVDAEKATIAFAAAAEKGGDATAQLTLRQQELIIKAAEQAKAMDEENRAQQEYLRVFNERIAAGDQLSVAQEAASAAAEKYALELGLEQVAHEGVRQAVLQEFEMKQQLAREIRADAAVAGIQQETTQLNAQIAILQQVIDHTKTRQEAEREIAIYLEEQKLIAAGVKENVHELAVQAVDVRDKFKEASDQVQKMGDGAIHVSDMIGDAFSQTLDGIIAGTLDLGDIWKSFGISFGKQLFENIWKEKLQFDVDFKGNILDLVGFVGDAFSGGNVDFTKILGGSGGNQAANWLNNLFGTGGGSSGGSSGGGFFNWLGGLFGGGEGGGGGGGGYPATYSTPGNSTDFTIGGDGEMYGYSEGAPPGYEGSGATSGSGAGGSFGDVLGGALSGYGTAHMLGQYLISSTGLPSGLKVVEDQALNRLRGLNDVIGAVLGAVASYFIGPLGGLVGGAVSSLVGSTWGPRVNRDALRNRGFGGGAMGGFTPPIFGGLDSGAWDLVGMTDPLAAGLVWNVLGLPTLGTAYRRAGETFIDQSPTLGPKGLQGLLGDWVRDKGNPAKGSPGDIDDNYATGIGTAIARGFSEEQAKTIAGGTGSIFSQLFKNDKAEDAGRLAEDMGNSMAEFLSRGLEKGMTFDDSMAALRAFAQESGITLKSSLDNLPKAMEQSTAAAMEFGKLDPFTAAQQGADTFATQLMGTTALFEQDYPAGVHLTALALEEMEKDGVKAFENLGSEGKNTLLNLTKDGELTHDVIAKLASEGFTVNTDELTNRLADISASAEFIGQNIGEIFTGDSVTDGINAMMAKLQTGIQEGVAQSQLKNLFDTTNIAASFEPVYAQMRRLSEDATLAGDPQFMNDMVAAIAEGRANLQEYIPQLQAMREASEQISEALAEAFKPDPIEQFWTTMADQMKENKDALDSFAGSLFEVASTAEMSGKGKGKTAARAAMQQQIDQTTFGQAQAAATLAATKTPQSEQLAGLSTEFQYKIAAAMQDGVVTGAEKADLQALKAKMDAAGETFADSVSANAAVLADLFLPDRIKASVDAAAGALSGAVGTASGSMFDVIKQGGSTTEAVKAFGESFKSSVKDNILQGMQEAMVESVVMEGALAEQMGMLKEVIKGAMVGGIDASEQAVIDQMIQNISTLTDQTLAELQPTLDTMAGTADKLVNGTTDSAGKLNDIKTVSDDAATKVDDLSKQATDSLGALSDAIKPDVTDDIGKGLDKLSVAFGDETTGGVTGAADALKNALGAEGLGATVGDIINQMGSTGLGASLQDAMDKMGSTGLGASLQEAMDALASGGTSSMVGAAEEAAGALKDNLAAGLLDAQDGLGDFAELLRNFKLPVANSAKGGSFSSGMSFVGEEGMELVVANEGGGFTVIPLSGTPHAADGISMDASGGATTIPLRGLPMMANGGSIGGSGSITLGLSPLMDAADLVVDGLRSMAAALDDARSSASSAATGLDSVATSSTSAAETQGGLLGAPHTRRKPPLGGPDEPGYAPITTDALEPEDFARIDETWKGLTGLFDRLFSSKDFTDEILNSDDVNASDSVLQLIKQLQITAGDGKAGPQDPFLNGENGPAGLDPGYLSPKTSVNDVRWYAKLLEEVGQKEFVDYLHARRVNAELFQESEEQVVPGGGLLPPVDYLEYSDKINKFFAEFGDDAHRADIGPMDFKVRAEGSLTQWLDPSKIKSSVSLSLDQAVNEFAAGGSVDSMRDSITKSVNKSMYDGLVQGMISALAVEDQQAILSAAVQDAMSDGFLDAADVDSLKTLAGEVAGKLSGSVEAMGPAFAAIADAFGIDLRNASTEAMTASADAIGGALRGALNDPFNFNMEALDQALRQNIFQAVAGGLIDAFVQTAIVQGALAPMFAIIQAEFLKITETQQFTAENNAVIAAQIAAMLGVLESDAFKEAMQLIVDSVADIRDGIGLVDTNLQRTSNDLQDTGDQFKDTAEDAGDACSGECELQTKLARTALGVSQASERAVEFGLEEIVPTYVHRNKPPGLASGGIVFRNGLFELAEGNRPEVVAPLDKLGSLTSATSSNEVSELRREVSELVKAFSNVRIVNQLDSRVLTDSTVGQMERRMRGGRRNFRRPPR